MATFSKKALEALRNIAVNAAHGLVDLENNLKNAAIQIASMTTVLAEQAGLVKGQFKDSFATGLSPLMAEAYAIKEYPTPQMAREANTAIKKGVATDVHKNVRAKLDKYGEARKAAMDRCNKAASRVLAHLAIDDTGKPVVKADKTGTPDDTGNRTPEARITHRVKDSREIAHKRSENAAKYLQPYCYDVESLLMLVNVAEARVAEAAKASANKMAMPQRVWEDVKPSIVHYEKEKESAEKK